MNDDGYTRITLRMPDALHAALTEEAARTSKSMNAEIISRLDGSFGASATVHVLRLKLDVPLSASLMDVIAAISNARKDVDPGITSVEIQFVPYGEPDFLNVIQRARALASVDGDGAAELLERFLVNYRTFGPSNDGVEKVHITREQALRSLEEGSAPVEPRPQKKRAK